MQYQMIGNTLIILADYLFIIHKLYVKIFQIEKNNQRNNLSKIFKLNHEESFELIFLLGNICIRRHLGARQTKILIRCT